MPTFVSMIRGINVGGARPVRMASLRGIYEGLGFEGVETYLQSGNVVFRAAKAGASRHAAAIERAILESCGFEVPVAVRTPEAMSAAVAANPFLGRRSIDAQFLHAVFLIGAAGTPSLTGAKLPLGPGEDAALAGDIVYVYCPNGYGTTKINNGFFERILSVRATTRNWRTVVALERMARGLPA